MQHLVCWTLMGLRSAGGREVWYQLGTFDSESLAAEAAASSYWPQQGFRNVSVVPYYRVDQNVMPTRPGVDAAARRSPSSTNVGSHTAV